MIKFFKLKLPEYFTSHSKPERLSKYIAKEKRLDRMENKLKIKERAKPSSWKSPYPIKLLSLKSMKGVTK